MTTESAIGKWVRREDGERKVAGRAVYAGDYDRPDLVHLRLVTSPYAHARILAIKTDDAAQSPGVVGVYTAQDLPIVPTDDLTRSRDPLARKRVYFYGHPVAVVAAETPAAAEDAVDLVEVEYEELDALIDPLQALGEDRIQVHDAETLGLRDDAGAHTSVSEHTQPLPRPANATSAQRYSRGNVE